MRFVPISSAKQGMVLSKAIYDEDHRRLLAPNMELTDEFIGRLKERGLAGFYIEDDLTKDIIIKEAIPEELRSKAVDCLVRQDIDATVGVASQIVDELRSSDVISIDLIDLRTFDEYTYRHSVNVAVLSTIVGIGMNLNNQTLLELCTAAILHDLGKLEVDQDIVHKPGRLTKQEYEIMKTHSFMSYERIKDKPEITARTKAAVLYHHENFDGTGYPKGLKGDEIHLLARIIHVVDVYDALTTARPYKSAYTPLESMDYLVSGIGTMFDGDVVNAFKRLVPIYPKGFSVALSNGEDAIIVENHMEDMSRPIVRTYDGETIDLANTSLDDDLYIVGINEEDIYEETIQFKKTRKHILIIDDMTVNLRIMDGILRDKYKVSCAKTVQQAVKLLYRRRPDLVLIDVDMPEINGLDAVKLIREDIDDTLQFMFVTSLSGSETVRKMKEANVSGYILKPFKPVFFLDKISEALGDGSVLR